MFLEILLILFGFALLIAGAEFLVRGASGLALKLGIPALVVGLTVVALGTSAPELVVGINSVLAEKGALALGAVVGSNVCNILLILGVAALFGALNIRESTLWIDLPVLCGSALLIALLAPYGVIGRTVAIGMTLGILAYIALSIWRAATTAAPQDDDVPNAPDALPLLVACIALGLVLLKFGGDFLVSGAVNIAAALEVNEAIIGLTIVAIGSSLPELATAISASLKGQGDLVVGNVIGSNIFNSLAILGISGLFGPIPYGGVSMLAIGFMLMASLVVVLLMVTDRRLDRWEGGVMLAMFVVYLVAMIVAG